MDFAARSLKWRLRCPRGWQNDEAFFIYAAESDRACCGALMRWKKCVSVGSKTSKNINLIVVEKNSHTHCDLRCCWCCVERIFMFIYFSQAARSHIIGILDIRRSLSETYHNNWINIDELFFQKLLDSDCYASFTMITNCAHVHEITRLPEDPELFREGEITFPNSWWLCRDLDKLIGEVHQLKILMLFLFSLARERLFMWIQSCFSLVILITPSRHAAIV